MLDLGKLQRYIRALENGDDNTRRQAIQSLKVHEDEEWAAAPRKVIHPLVESLREQLASDLKQATLRQEVVTILGNIGPRSERAIPQLVELLQQGNPENVREAAATALGNIGDSSRTVRAALNGLWQSPPPSQNSQVQIAIALCKLKIDAVGLLRFLTHIVMAHQSSSLRQGAAEALACCNKNDTDVVPALLTAALNDKDEHVREIAQASLEQLRLPREKAIQVCAKQLENSIYAETALRMSGPAAVPALIDALDSNTVIVRAKAARLLSRLGELAAAAVPKLRTALHDKHADIRLAAAKALWNITKNADLAVPVLVDLLKEKWVTAQDGPEARRQFVQTVIEAMQRIGPPAKDAVPALTEKARNKNRLISESAVRALQEIAPAAASKISLRLAHAIA